MAIPIEGLVSREPIQEKNSLPSKENRLINGSKSGTFSQVGRFTLRMLGSAGLAFSPLVIACSPDAKAIPPSPATVPPEASATFVPGGFGGPNPIATYPKEDPRAGRLNPIIDRINDPKKAGTVTNDERNQVTLARGADNTATAAAGGKIPPEGTQVPKETPTPTEVKKIEAFKYDLLPPELQDTAELINFKNKLGNWVTLLAWQEVDGKFPITAPGTGSFRRNLDDPYKSTIEVVAEKYKINVELYGDFMYPNNNIAYTIDSEKPKVVANMGQTGYRRGWGPEKFALVVGASATAGEGSPSREQILRQFSPKAFEKSARIVEAEFDPNPQITSAISVSPKP